jgi:predicted Zn-dependent protease
VFLAASVMLTASAASAKDSPLRRANKLYEKGRFANAVEAYTAALEQDPQNAKALYNRALANEMVDRAQAIADWQRFLAVADDDPQWKHDTPKVKGWLEVLQKKPALPATLQSAAYVAKDGDYYEAIADASEGRQWTHFPVKVFIEDTPEAWQRATERALDEWGQVIPLELTKERDSADIVLTWTETPTPSDDRVGSETDSVTTEKRGSMVIARRRRALVAFNTSRRWSESEMHFGALHELGHALGILGHSTSDQDIMFPDQQEVYEVSQGGESPRGVGERGPSGVTSIRVVPKRLSAADINTLIRLYNCAGFSSVLE